MSQELLTLYRKIQETPALTVDFPKKSGKGRILRLDTNAFSLTSWKMEFHRETCVAGNVAREMRLIFCRGEGVEWLTPRGRMRLDPNEACFCLSDGSPESMCYAGNAPFSFLTVSMPADRFARLIGEYMPDLDKWIAPLNGRRFAISAAIQKSLREIGPLEAVHDGFERMRLEGRLLENLSICLQAGLGEPIKRPQLHREDRKVICALGKRIEDDPALIPDVATLAREYCMSVSKLTRNFRQVYGTSLHAYVIASRLQKGAELLAHDGCSIQEIAERVGYNKLSQFSADFRKQFGMLPGEYRRCC